MFILYTRGLTKANQKCIQNGHFAKYFMWCVPHGSLSHIPRSPSCHRGCSHHLPHTLRSRLRWSTLSCLSLCCYYKYSIGVWQLQIETRTNRTFWMWFAPHGSPAPPQRGVRRHYLFTRTSLPQPGHNNRSATPLATTPQHSVVGYSSVLIFLYFFHSRERAPSPPAR